MPGPYKLKAEIKQFIIEKKKIDPKLSCRSIIPLIKENFRIDLSKSAINSIIKENSLSSKVGRPRIRPKVSPKPVTLGSYPVIIPAVTAGSVSELAVVLPAPAALVSEPVVVLPTPIAQVPAPGVISPEPVAPAPITPLPEPVVARISDSPVSGPVHPTEDVPKIQVIDIKPVRVNGQGYYLKNGGALFLVAADQKSGLTDFLSGKLAVYMPDLSREALRIFIRGRIYSQIFPDKADPWGLLGKELVCSDPGSYYERLSAIPLGQLDMDFFRLGLEHNINDINTLYKQCLLRLNSLVQTFFFPTVYQFLDFATMYNRFYSLAARIDVKDGLVDTQFFYQDNFSLVYDIVWQEDFKFVINKINSEKIFAEGEQFRFGENITFLDMKTVSFK